MKEIFFYLHSIFFQLNTHKMKLEIYAERLKQVKIYAKRKRVRMERRKKSNFNLDFSNNDNDDDGDGEMDGEEHTKNTHMIE
jgi:flagella basal body P-ring formation protein FlgA